MTESEEQFFVGLEKHIGDLKNNPSEINQKSIDIIFSLMTLAAMSIEGKGKAQENAQTKKIRK